MKRGACAEDRERLNDTQMTAIHPAVIFFVFLRNAGCLFQMWILCKVAQDSAAVAKFLPYSMVEIPLLV